MNFRITKLDVQCRGSVEVIEFQDITYFYGEIGSGKSTIAILIDFCLGGDLVDTPALQAEFISATLHIDISDTPLSLSRAREANIVEAVWGQPDNESVLAVPVRSGKTELVPDTGIFILSDLLFYLLDIKPPYVRRRKKDDESPLQRLSFRNLWSFCYLDQDHIDSSFFNLESTGDHYRQLASKNAMRFILGFHHEQIAQLEVEHREVRDRRQAVENAAHTLASTLSEAGFETSLIISSKISDLEQQLERTISSIRNQRDSTEHAQNHVNDKTRQDIQRLSQEIEALESAISESEDIIQSRQQYLHELHSLSVKFRRQLEARAILGDVNFERCPKCTQSIPSRSPAECSVCGQPEPQYEAAEEDISNLDADLADQVKEVNEFLNLQGAQKKNLQNRLREYRNHKSALDAQYQEMMKEYDSAYLARALEDERRRSAITEEIASLNRLKVLPEKVEELRVEADTLEAKEKKIRGQLANKKEHAERDLANINRLKVLFLDCLTRTKLPGFSHDDNVTIDPAQLFPEVTTPESGDIVLQSFDTLSSGGKKTLFKCCYAVALHRLAVEIGAILPPILIIDSPMKNISERENRSQFEGFHRLIYELAQGELSSHQFILIDKEHIPSPDNLDRTTYTRHMTVDDDNNPPLITGYRDHDNTEVENPDHEGTEAPDDLGIS